MDTDRLKELLSELQFAASLPPKALEQLAVTSQVRDFAAGSVLFKEGSESHDLYLIAAGQVALDMNVPGRGSVRILTLGAGDMVGWSAVLAEGRMTATALAVTQTRAVVASGEKLLELCESDHEVGYQLMRRMATALSRRLVATRLQLLDLFSDDPPNLPSEIEVQP